MDRIAAAAVASAPGVCLPDLDVRKLRQPPLQPGPQQGSHGTLGSRDANAAGRLAAQLAEHRQLGFDVREALCDTLRVVRFSNFRSSLRSSDQTVWLSPDWATPICAAARVKLRTRTTALAADPADVLASDLKIVLDISTGRRPRPDRRAAVHAGHGGAGVRAGSGRACERWSQVGSLGPLLAGVVLLALFLLNEARVTQPILPLRLFAHRSRVGACAARVLFLCRTIGFCFYTTPYLQGVLGMLGMRPMQAVLRMTGG